MATMTDLYRRQRSVPPPPLGGRRAHSAGGDADGGEGRTLAPGLNTEQARYPGTHYDTEIRRDKTPWFPRDHMVPGGLSWVNWTAAGPLRAELHMRDVTVRTMQGNTNSRALQDPRNPQRGLHTNPMSGVGRTVERFVNPAVPSMTGARVDRLSNARYDGQSYSQTTRVQGTGVRR
jgi:hypothetical protein